MKKRAIKLLCTIFSAIIILNSCSNDNFANISDKPIISIDTVKYLLKIELRNCLVTGQYSFILTPDNKLISQYRPLTCCHKETEKKTVHTDSCGYFEQAVTELKGTQLDIITECLLQTKADMIDRDIGRFTWYATGLYEDIYIDDKHATFFYGCADSFAANILTEAVIGSSNLRILESKELQRLNGCYDIAPMGTEFRKAIKLFAETN